jgi:CRP/FNR family nitrogen fixation transcriptional regulator
MATQTLASATRTVTDALRPRGPEKACALCDVFDEDALTQVFAAGRELCRQGDASYKVFRVRSGAAAAYRLFSDGRRQVMSFYLPGDFIGLEAGVEYSTTVVSLTQTTVDVMRRSELSDIAATDPALARALWGVCVQAFHRSEAHALVLARHGAVERVAAFLVDFAARPGAGLTFELPMTRQDLADYLGLTIHTVSRTLSQLEASGLIEARSSRVVRLLQPECLEGMLQ